MDLREAADRLLAATEARRVELGKKWKQVYEEAGLTHQTLNRWRNGAPVDPLTDRALERALLWAPGAREAIAAGQSPAALGDSGQSASTTPSTRSEQLPSRELETLAEMVASAAQGFDLTPEQLKAAYLRAQQIIEERQHRRSVRDDTEGPSRRNRAS